MSNKSETDKNKPPKDVGYDRGGGGFGFALALLLCGTFPALMLIFMFLMVMK